ncbi:MAG: bifunctional enoyl-CoA hydratase/phosphate acetyltransferase [Alphaproteobacteria bacterium]|nr:bifunctional enoyl-CoA hydratase/phosphate acetyltransferase [Alphaproteobacteria bacterium]
MERNETEALFEETVVRRYVARMAGAPPVATAICHPCSGVALRGAVEAAAAGLIVPILVAPPDSLARVAEAEGLDIGGFEVHPAEHSHHAAELAVALCRSGAARLLMKGSLHTDELMHAVTAQATGLRTERRISHVFVMTTPALPRPLLISDAAINIAPDLLEKADIVQNAIDLAHVLGLKLPKVAILSAVETVNPKLRSTIDAAVLCKMADRGQITGALLDGPLAFDNAISAEAAAIKGIRSEVAGQADILIVPDLESGNMLAKQLDYLGGALAAGLVMGARVPIVLTSRADRAPARLASCAIGALVAAAGHVAIGIKPGDPAVHGPAQ